MYFGIAFFPNFMRPLTPCRAALPAYPAASRRIARLSSSANISVSANAASVATKAVAMIKIMRGTRKRGPGSEVR